MNVSQSTLDQWRQELDRARIRLSQADSAASAGRMEVAREHIQEARCCVGRVNAALEEHGANRPEYLAERSEIPLTLLDTPANRGLLAKLLEALEAAEEVDRERGYGNDGLAQLIEDWAAKVQLEVFGPEGAGEGVAKND